MGKKKRAEEGAVTNTTPSAIVEIGSLITTLVEAGTLDTRCAGKLLDRLEKEEELMDEQDAEQALIKHALKGVKRAIREVDAKTFVSASAALRESTEEES